MAKVAHVQTNKTNKESASFSSDNRYRKSKIDELNALEEELNSTQDNEEGGDLESQDNQPVNTEPKDKPKGGDWEKRYKELQSFYTKKTNDLEKQVEQLQETVEQAQKEEIVYPKSEQEVAEWMSKYPDVADIVQTMILKTTKESNSQSQKELKKTLDALQQEKTKIALEKAKADLIRKQPDFPEIVESSEFIEWLAEQPQSIIDTIDRPSLDDKGVAAASRTIDLFKLETKTSKNKTDPKEAAQRVKQSTSTKPDGEQDSTRYSESQILKMTSQEYEKHADKIVESQRNGTFDYDISGAAR